MKKPNKLLLGCCAGILVIIVLAGLFAAAYYFGYLESLNLPEIPLISQPPKLTLTPAQPVPDTAKSKEIPADEGGSITIVNEEGIKATVIIPPGALDKDREITLGEISKVPIEDYEQEDVYEFILEPVSLKFDIPVTFIFDLDPTDDPSTSSGQAEESQNEEEELETAEALTSPYASAMVSELEEDLTEEEVERRKEAEKISINDNTGVIYTDSSAESAGSTVFLSPSTIDSDNSQISTQTSQGGTITIDQEITEGEARDFAESIINDPDATPEQTLEALEKSQEWGFEDLDKKAKDKLKNKMKDIINEMSQKCEEGKVDSPISRKDILGWQEMAQGLGFEEEENEASKLLEKCKGYYSIHIEHQGSIPGCAECTMHALIQASVCGFIDDQWQGNNTMTFTFPGGWTGEGHYDLEFALPPDGGTATTPITVDIQVSHPDAGTYTASALATLPIHYDGVDTVQIGPDPNYQAEIKFQKQCEDSSTPDTPSTDEIEVPSTEDIEMP